MNKDEIAIYLNDHLEFFNEYPELLKRIKAIDDGDLPLAPTGTLSLADRIIKRAHQDKKQLENQLEWFVEISQTNEKIQEHLFEIERSILTSSNLDQLVSQLQEEIRSRFEIPHVAICLVDGGDHFIESKLKENYGDSLNNALQFVDQETLARWFEGGKAPVLKAEVEDGSEWLSGFEEQDAIQSAALIPILVREAVAGAFVLGSAKQAHFHPGLRSEFLERMAEKMAIAISNIFLVDRLRRQTVIDKQTGLYNQAYLEPVLNREFDLARRRKKSLSCVKLRIDYFSDLLDTWGETAGETVLGTIGQILKTQCRFCDILIRTDMGEFLALLPEIDRQGALLVAERIRTALVELLGREFNDVKNPQVAIGVSTYPEKAIETQQDLLQAAFRDMDSEKALTEKRAV
jgi:diguanylate cyclase (GGDEF)-like protein